MDGIFIRKKPAGSIIFLLSGILLIGLYIFAKIVDSEASGILFILFIIGILSCLTAIASMMFNHKAYFHIEENSIHAKYHWFGKLECNIHEIAFILPQTNSLTIVLHNEKRHTITGIANSQDLSHVLRTRSFSVETTEPHILQQELEHRQTQRKNGIRWVVGGIAVMFLIIFIAAILTDGKDLDEFYKKDWIILAVMAVLELLVLIGLFYAAVQCGSHLIPIEHLKFRIKGAIIVSHPLPSNNIQRVYTDINHTGRVVVCGFPNDGHIYYCVQQFNNTMKLKTVYTSEVFADMEELDVSDLMDITSQTRS